MSNPAARRQAVQEMILRNLEIRYDSIPDLPLLWGHILRGFQEAVVPYGEDEIRSALADLVERGLVRVEDVPSGGDLGDKGYVITPDGRDFLDAQCPWHLVSRFQPRRGAGGAGRGAADMANIAHSEVYERIAVAAARKAGSKALTPEAVALDPEGRAARDLAWAEYDRVLADVRTYRLEAIRKWLAERGVRASTSPIHRDRARILRVRRQVELANARTREGLELMKDLSAGDVLEGAMTRAGQILYEKFSRLDLESLEGLTPSQILNAFQAAGYLKKVAGDAALQGARLAEIRRRFDESVEAAQKKGSGGRLTDDDVREIRKAVFGDGA